MAKGQQAQGSKAGGTCGAEGGSRVAEAWHCDWMQGGTEPEAEAQEVVGQLSETAKSPKHLLQSQNCLCHREVCHHAGGQMEGGS